MPTQLSALAQELDDDTVNALLLGRASNLLDADSDRYDTYLELVAGAADEVETIVGPDPQPTSRRRLALRAIAYGTAADLEVALFPEQQLGEDARALYLRRRYDQLLVMLRDDDGSPVDGVPGPTGSFPTATPYPDPVERHRTWGHRC